MKSPGPGNYYQFGAGNYNPNQRHSNNNPINDARALDDQWNNKTHSIKFNQQINKQMGFSMLAKGSFKIQSGGNFFSPKLASTNTSASGIHLPLT